MHGRRIAPLIICALLLVALVGVLAFLQSRAENEALSPTRAAESAEVDRELDRPDSHLKAPEESGRIADRRPVSRSESSAAASNLHLRLQIVDGAGAPVPRFMLSVNRVIVRRQSAVLRWADHVTLDGRFEYAIPPRAGWEEAVLEVGVTGEGYHTTVLELTAQELASNEVRCVVLTPARSLAGIVVEEDGMPIGLADVTALDERGESIAGATTDHEGTFEIAPELVGVLDRAVALSVEARGFTSRRIEMESFGGAWDGVRIVMDRGFSIAGLVGGSGECETLAVSWRLAPDSLTAVTPDSGRAQRVEVSADGSFILELVPDARIMIAASCEYEGGSRRKEAYVDANQAAVYGVQIDLGDMHELRGSVTLAGLSERHTVLVEALGGEAGLSESSSLWLGPSGSDFTVACPQIRGSEVTLRIYWTLDLYVERVVTVGGGPMTDLGAILVQASEREAALPR